MTFKKFSEFIKESAGKFTADDFSEMLTKLLTKTKYGFRGSHKDKDKWGTAENHGGALYYTKDKKQFNVSVSNAPGGPYGISYFSNRVYFKTEKELLSFIDADKDIKMEMKTADPKKVYPPGSRKD